MPQLHRNSSQSQLYGTERQSEQRAFMILFKSTLEVESIIILVHSVSQNMYQH